MSPIRDYLIADDLSPSNHQNNDLLKIAALLPKSSPLKNKFSVLFSNKFRSRSFRIKKY